MIENSENTQIKPQPEWERAKPHILPEPTYWPFFLAMGLTFVFWGLLSIWLILAAGALIMIIALIGWINLLRHD